MLRSTENKNIKEQPKRKKSAIKNTNRQAQATQELSNIFQAGQCGFFAEHFQDFGNEAFELCDAVAFASTDLEVLPSQKLNDTQTHVISEQFDDDALDSSAVEYAVLKKSRKIKKKQQIRKNDNQNVELSEIERSALSSLPFSDSATEISEINDADVLEQLATSFAQYAANELLTEEYIVAQLKLQYDKSKFSPTLLLSILHLIKPLWPSGSSKYGSMSEFVIAYPNFADLEIQEKVILMEEANWMNKLFLILPAKKNKGITLAVITKFIEGIEKRYVTGSGQTAATQRRVDVYERESNTVPRLRQKRKKAGEEEFYSSILDILRAPSFPQE